MGLEPDNEATARKRGSLSRSGRWILLSGLLGAACVVALIQRPGNAPSAPSASSGSATFAAFRDASPRVVARSDMEERGSLWFVTGESDPFSGVMEDRYDAERVKSRCTVAAGRLDGLAEGWHTNGQMQVRESFQAGLREGVVLRWYDDGRQESETHYVGGKLNGVYRKWHRNGALAYHVTYRDGRPDGTSWAYFPSGYLKAEAVMANGEVVRRTTWKDGEVRQLASAR